MVTHFLILCFMVERSQGNCSKPDNIKQLQAVVKETKPPVIKLGTLK